MPKVREKQQYANRELPHCTQVGGIYQLEQVETKKKRKITIQKGHGEETEENNSAHQH